MFSIHLLLVLFIYDWNSIIASSVEGQGNSTSIRDPSPPSPSVQAIASAVASVISFPPPTAITPKPPSPPAPPTSGQQTPSPPPVVTGNNNINNFQCPPCVCTCAPSTSSQTVSNGGQSGGNSSPGYSHPTLVGNVLGSLKPIGLLPGILSKNETGNVG